MIATPDLSAWDAYQKGMWHTYRRTRDDVLEARRYFQRCIDLDPNFAPAYTGFAHSLFYALLFAWSDSGDDARDRALAMVKKAVELDSDDPNARAVLGAIHSVRREPVEAVAELELAIELSPSLSIAHHWLGMAKVWSGRSSEALPELQEAIRLSPRDPITAVTMARIAEAHLFQGNYEAALEWARKAVRDRRAPQVYIVSTLAAALGHFGQISEANRVRDQLLQIAPEFSCSFVEAN